MNKLEDLNLKNQLEENLKNSCGLRKYCLNHILEEYEEYEEIKNFFTDLFNGGCVSGMISDLIYYEDTIKFFDRNEELITDFLNQEADDLGVDGMFKLFNKDYQCYSIDEFKNWASWYIAETVAHEIANNNSRLQT